MRVTLNGKPAEVAAGTLADVLAELELAGAKVATALNGEFVPARRRTTTIIKEGDKLEIVAPMQGG